MKYNNRVLIVDDTESIHQDFRSVLSYVPEHPDLDLDAFLDGVIDRGVTQEKSLQYRIDSAFQGEDAYEMVKKALAEDDPYTLVFLDVRMPPGWDGIRTAAEIWHVAPDTEIVICTAYSDYSWDAILEKLGTSDRLMFLKKPFDAITVKQMALSQVRKWNLGYKSRSVMQTLESEVKKRTVQLEESLLDLERSKKVIEDIIDSINAAIFLIDSKFVVHEVNHSATNFFVMPTDKRELKGQNLFPLIDPRNVEETARGFETHLKTLSMGGEESSFDWALINPGSPDRIFSVSISKLHSRDDHYLVAFYDITEKRKEQHYLQRKQRMESVGLLAGGIAHEFNNIIAGIQGYAQLALKGSSQELYHRGAEVTERQCKRATELVRGLLTFSRSGSVGLERVDVSAVCEEVIILTSKNSGARAIKVTKSLDHKAFIEGEVGPLQQVVMNLIINAQHAMATAAVKELDVTVAIECSSVVLKVSDTGHGIDKDAVSHVFDPFFTTKGALGGGGVEEKIHGTGLGLSVVMGVVNDFGGTIEVESDKGSGTTFTVRLPAIGGESTTKRVLIVDDDLDLLKVYSRWIRQANCVPLVASTAKMGHDLFKQESPDLILLDQTLPDGEGHELLEAMRAVKCDVPIVMVTATVDRSCAKEFLAAGATDCFFKPLNHTKINTILNQYLRQGGVPHPERPADASGENLQGKRVLIADDEPVVRNVYKAICQRSGLEVSEASDGSEAVNLSRENEYDLILMDIAMPEMDGVSAIKEIKQVSPYTPIVVCTGFLTDMHKDAYQAGALRVLNKPVGVKDLIATISEVLCN